jgi:hypothetical protein
MSVQETPAGQKTEEKVLLKLETKDQIKADQDGIRTSIVALDMNVHANAVQCLMHAEKHGDTSLMARLLNDVLDEKTGYNRRGLIRWMRMFSPMELDGKKITLTGVDEDGNKRPFLISKANATPFYLSSQLNQQGAKPVFQDTLVSKFDTMVKEFENSWANTQNVNGELVAIDTTKPHYIGTPAAAAKVIDFITAGKVLRGNLSSDDSREIYMAKQRLAKDALIASGGETKAA